MLQSPTGPGVLFVSTRTGDTWSLSAHEVDAIRQVTLLYEAPVDPRPTVSPDRSRLAYFSYFLKSYRVTTISLLDGSIDYFPLPDPDTRPVDLAWMPDAESLLVSVDTVDGMRLDRLNLPQQRRMQSESGGSSDASIGLVDRWNTGIVAADLSLAPSDIVSPNGQYAVYERVHPLTRIHTLSLAPVAGIASPIAIYRGVWPIESVWMSDRALLIGSCGSDACSILQQQIDENAATLLFTLEAERIGRVAFLPAMDEGS